MLHELCTDVKREHTILIQWCGPRRTPHQMDSQCCVKNYMGFCFSFANALFKVLNLKTKKEVPQDDHSL